MKVCPNCNQTYADDTLNFCLSDGVVLTQISDAGASSEPAPTMLINQTRPTAANAQFDNQAANWGVVTPNAAQTPKPKSRTWLWVLGIFSGLILLCGGGFAALLAIVANNDDSRKNSNYVYNSANSVKNSAAVIKDNPADWKPESDNDRAIDYANGQLVMSSKNSGYFYVLITPKKDSKTENATTKITVRNMTGEKSQHGYGLLVHSSQISPLLQDYAFLIDSNTQNYRVVRHAVKVEKTVVEWTYSAAIKNGTQDNVLEVKDENGEMSFYINGEFVTTYNDTNGSKTGVAGLYVSSVPVAFSAFEIRK